MSEGYIRAQVVNVQVLNQCLVLFVQQVFLEPPLVCQGAMLGTGEWEMPSMGSWS